MGVLASGGGSNLQALLDGCSGGEIDAQVAVVVSHREGAGALTRARQAGVPAIALPVADWHDPVARQAYEDRLLATLQPHDLDLLVLGGWMFILSARFLERCRCPIINVHPALLPLDGRDPSDDPLLGCRIPVLRGAHAVRDAIAFRLPYTGVTVHYVTPEVDAGPVVLREVVPISPEDNEASLYARIKSVEHRLVSRSIQNVLEGIHVGGVYA